MCDAATGPDGRACRPVAGSAGPLLAPRLPAAAGDLRPGLGGVRAGTKRGQTRDDDLMHERHVHRRLEQLRRKVGVADLLAGRVANGHLGHQPALPAGALTAERTMTRPPEGPGTAPRRSSRLRSASAWTTSRFSTVTRAFPIWPAIRVPLKTLDGVAHAPIAPGER